MKKDLYNKIFAPSDCLSQQLLTGYLKGTLNEQETHKVEEHLVDCELCSEALDGLMLVKDETVLGAVSNDVKNVIHKNKNKKKVSPIGIWLAAAASLAIIIASVIAIRTVTNESNRQLALQEVKIPVVKDSLKSEEKTEDDHSVLIEANEATSENSIVENTPNEPRQIRTFNSQTPAEPQLNSEIASAESTDDRELVAASEESVEADAVFSDKMPEDLAAKTQTIKTTATEPAAGSLSEIKTIASNKSATEKSKQQVQGSEIAFVQDLKIFDYSKQREEKVLEPPANNTEAKFATPEVKQEAATVSIDEPVDYKNIISPALEAYKQGKYSVAISLLNSMLKENPSDINAKFYSGMANFHLENYSNSLEFLKSLIKKNNNVFFEEAKFYAALNYIELSEISKARNLLKEVIDMNSFYKNRAEEKLKELK